MNEEIVKQFYNIYFRPPKRSEFIQCGGDIEKIEKKYGGYSKFMKLLGYYSAPSNVETYEVINVYGVVIFTGTALSIAEEFNTTHNNVTTRTRKNGLLKGKYEVVMKPFTTAAANSIRKEVSRIGVNEREVYIKQVQKYILNKVKVSESAALGVAKVLYKFKDDKMFLQLIEGD